LLTTSFSFLFAEPGPAKQQDRNLSSEAAVLKKPEPPRERRLRWLSTYDVRAAYEGSHHQHGRV